MSTRVIGDVCEWIESSFEWTIPNWKLCNKGETYIWISPSFKFWDATWQLEISSFCWDEISLRLVRNIWVQNRQIITIKLSSKQKDGYKYKAAEKECEFTEETTFSDWYIKWGLIFHPLVNDGSLIISCSLSGKHNIANTAIQRAEEVCSKEKDIETETHDTEVQEKPCKRGTKDFEKLSRNFKDLLVTGEDSDVTVKVNDQEFLVHKIILGARSPVFGTMFRHDMTEKKEGVVVITDCAPDAFKEFLSYLYCGELDEFSRNTVFELYLLSDKYDVPELKSASVEFIAEDLCIDTFCDVVHLALQHSEAVLLENATKFFKKNLKKIIVSVKWQSFIKENPIQANELYVKALNDVLPE